MFQALRFILLIFVINFHAGFMSNLTTDKMEYSTISESTDSYESTNNINETDTEIIEEVKEPSWLDLMNTIQGAMTTLGLLLNILTMVTLKLNGSGFKSVIRTLLSHQAFVDMSVCVMALMIIVVPPMRLVGENPASFVICQAFHSQALYWSVTWISITSLEVIAWERYMAICHPLKHADVTRKIIYRILFVLYPLSPLAMGMSYVQVKYHEGKCLPVFYFDTQLFKNLMGGFSVWSFLVLYAIPCLFFVFSYGSIVYTLVARQRQSQLAQSRVIDAATKQLTKTAMVVTGWFIIALGYDLWYYVLGYNNVVVYKKNTPVQKAGIFLAGSNSCVNPVIYFMFMPAYRQSVMKTLGCGRGSAKSQKSPATSMTSVSVVERSAE